MTSKDGPGIRRAKTEAGHLTTSVLKDDKTIPALSKFKKLVHSSRGPSGCLKMLHNNIGGHVTLTSVCKRMLDGLSVKTPVLKLLVSCVQGHASSYSDSSLFLADLALSLILGSLELDIHPRLVTDVLEYLMLESLNFLQVSAVELASFIHQFNTNDLTDMSNITHTVLTSKPGCDFWAGEADHITSMLVTAFLKTSAESQHNLQYLTIEGISPAESFMTDGMLYAMPSIPVYKTKPISVERRNTRILVAVFNLSFAGDTSETMDSTILSEDSTAIDRIILQKMMTLCDDLVSLGVGVVACQRVIHPEIKRRLRRENVLVLDRLGIQYIYCIQVLTGAKLLGSFSGSVVESDLGVVEDVQHKVIQNKSYVHLTNKLSPVHTIVLCGRSEESLADLKATCKTAYDVLGMAWRDGKTLSGGGCWQTALAAAVWNKVRDAPELLMDELGCTRSQLLAVTRVFCKSLTNCLPNESSITIMSDKSFNHRWKIDTVCDDSAQHCVCGAVPISDDNLLQYSEELFSDKDISFPSKYDTRGTLSKPQVLDSYSANINALRVGISSAIMILNIQNVIQDVN